MQSKEKQKLVSAFNGLISALRKGYEVLNQDGQIPDVTDEELPSMAHFVARSLKAQITAITDNEKYDGLSEEEILEKKEQDKQEAIEQLQADSAKQLKEMRGEKEPEPEPEPEQEPQ